MTSTNAHFIKIVAPTMAIHGGTLVAMRARWPTKLLKHSNVCRKYYSKSTVSPVYRLKCFWYLIT